jgi:protoheme IX farnesyltransferase
MIQDPHEVSTVSSPSTPRVRHAIANRFRDYFALTKPDVNALIVISTVAGAWLAFASRHLPFAPAEAANAVLGTALVASGAGALNQALEKPFDALMSRTLRRPVASGRVSVFRAACFGSVLAGAGFFWLLATVNVPAALLALFALAVYILVYTPLKRHSPLSLIVGAIAGAVPPLIGWFAGGGALNLEAALIFSVLFLWQFPHFMAIAWICRSDYDRAGYRIIPASPSRLRFIALATIVPAVALLALTLFFALARGALNFVPLLAFLGLAFLALGACFVVLKSNSAARRLLAASIYYLPVVFVLLILVATYKPSVH